MYDILSSAVMLLWQVSKEGRKTKKRRVHNGLVDAYGGIVIDHERINFISHNMASTLHCDEVSGGIYH